MIKDNENVLRVRDDEELRFKVGSTPVGDGDSDPTRSYEVIGAKPSWLERDLSARELRARIEPWLGSLFQSEHLTLLAGSGLTHAVHILATGKPAAGMASLDLASTHKESIKAAASQAAARAGRAPGNLEDQLRSANELHRGLEILGSKSLEREKEATELSKELEKVMTVFVNSILESERAIAGADETARTKALSTLVEFLMSFASRPATRDRLSIFTTNYDRLIEAGAELAGIHLLDRFVGTIAPIFRSSRLELDLHYNPPGIRGEPRYLEGVARFTKLHGSIDWAATQQDIRRFGLPFGSEDFAPFLRAPQFENHSAGSLMIFPNAFKDRETAEYPYVDLFRDFAAAICRPNTTLVTYGYSFGDEHINRVIRDMLTIPSTHLVVVSFNDPLGRISTESTRIGHRSQVSLLIGPYLSNLETVTAQYLPRPSIDRATFRVAELVRQRLGANASTIASGDSDKGTT